MQAKNNTGQRPAAEEQDIHTFRREDGIWYIHLPVFIERGWPRQELRLTEGAHKFLNFLSNGGETLRLRISTQPLKDAGTLEIVEHCAAPRGGAIYLFVPAHEDSQGSLFWICDLALFVFGDIPDRIFVQRLRSRTKPALPPGSGMHVSQQENNGLQPTPFSH